MAQASPLVQAVTRELRKFPSLDPDAVLADARGEGLGGGIGDNGTSFGPFQLHYGGAYPSYAPQGAAASQQWAWSPAGIDYALGRINSVAGGLKGAQAVDAIVRRFERPADPDAAVRTRVGYLGLTPTGGSSAQMPPLAAAAAAPPRPLPGPPGSGGAKPRPGGILPAARPATSPLLQLALQLLKS